MDESTPPRSHALKWIGLACVGFVLWYVFFRDINTQPDNRPPPRPPTPANRPIDDFRAAWSSNEAANWRVAQHLVRLSSAAYEDLPGMRQTAEASASEKFARSSRRP